MEFEGELIIEDINGEVWKLQSQRCHFEPNKILTLAFNGNQDGQKYTGEFKAIFSGNTLYQGEGSIKYDNDPKSYSIKVALSTDSQNHDLNITGTYFEKEEAYKIISSDFDKIIT